MKKTVALFVVLVAAAAIGQTLDYEADVQPIFSTQCVLCHGDLEPLPAGLDLSAGQSYENLVNAVSTNYAPAVRVAPGSLEESVLWNKISDTRAFGGVMKPIGKISQDKIDVITAWILELEPVSVENETWGAVKNTF